jgi:prevent-host-death family protein
MIHRISATELSRTLGDVLGRVRYRHDAFVVERNGDPIARIVPVPDATLTSVLEGLTAWREGGASDPSFADDLERVGDLDRPPSDAWAS